MTYKELKNEVKEEQKDRAVKIRILKTARKPHVYNSNPELYNKLGDLERHQYDYRHIHITYCMFFNKTEYSNIEKKCHEKPNSAKLTMLKKKWSDIVEANRDEALRVG